MSSLFFNPRRHLSAVFAEASFTRCEVFNTNSSSLWSRRTVWRVGVTDTRMEGQFAIADLWSIEERLSSNALCEQWCQRRLASWSHFISTRPERQGHKTAAKSSTSCSDWRSVSWNFKTTNEFVQKDSSDSFWDRLFVCDLVCLYNKTASLSVNKEFVSIFVLRNLRKDFESKENSGGNEKQSSFGERVNSGGKRLKIKSLKKQSCGWREFPFWRVISCRS